MLLEIRQQEALSEILDYFEEKTITGSNYMEMICESIYVPEEDELKLIESAERSKAVKKKLNKLSLNAKRVLTIIGTYDGPVISNVGVLTPLILRSATLFMAHEREDSDLYLTEWIWQLYAEKRPSEEEKALKAEAIYEANVVLAATLKEYYHA